MESYMNVLFNAMFIIVPVLALGIIAFTFAQFISPRFRAKMMSRQVKSMKYMMDESKDDIESISSDMADATEYSIETSARALRRGLFDEKQIYCKHCGRKIDADSRFCKSCGREQ